MSQVDVLVFEFVFEVELFVVEVFFVASSHQKTCRWVQIVQCAVSVTIAPSNNSCCHECGPRTIDLGDIRIGIMLPPTHLDIVCVCVCVVCNHFVNFISLKKSSCSRAGHSSCKT